MSIKYAIYKKPKLGFRAVEYIDTLAGLKDFPYIREDSLPVIVNNVGGYTSFNKDYEKDKGFLKIVTLKNEEDEPLTLEEMYPKNSDKFEYGWIDIEGNTYATEAEGHSDSAYYICKELKYNSYYPEHELEKRNWIKVTASWENGVRRKLVYVEDYSITKAQYDKICALNLDGIPYTDLMLRCSKERW